MISHEQIIIMKILLFISGFTILSIEILGIRILGPYVGTTVPVWAALIGVTLAGTALGYYGGGRLADHVQKKEVFLWITACASIFIVLIPTFRSIMNSTASNSSYGVDALIGSTLLFFIPILCLSALITYSIRFFVKNLDTIAQVHGDLYALATFGSILGVFGTSYILVPLFSIPHIFYGLGGILLLIGVLAALPSNVMNEYFKSKMSAN